jgi:hypothetical protein
LVLEAKGNVCWPGVRLMGAMALPALVCAVVVVVVVVGMLVWTWMKQKECKCEVGDRLATSEGRRGRERSKGGGRYG